LWWGLAAPRLLVMLPIEWAQADAAYCSPRDVYTARRPVAQYSRPAAGGIPLLLALFASPDAVENASRAVANLSHNVRCRTPIVAAGGVVPLVALLRSPLAVVQLHAAIALRFLAMHDESRISISAACGIPHFDRAF
jgi:hypothetical protein